MALTCLLDTSVWNRLDRAPALAAKVTTPWTESDYLALPEDPRRIELLDGGLLVTRPRESGTTCGSYVEVTSSRPGELMRLAEPFPLELDLTELAAGDVGGGGNSPPDR